MKRVAPGGTGYRLPFDCAPFDFAHGKQGRQGRYDKGSVIRLPITIYHLLDDFGEFVGEKALPCEVEHDIRVYRIW